MRHKTLSLCARIIMYEGWQQHTVCAKTLQREATRTRGLDVVSSEAINSGPARLGGLQKAAFLAAVVSI